MQGDGNLVEYDGTTPAWATGTNSSGSSVAMQGDGNLVVYDSSHNPKWASNTSGNSGAYLVLTDNGILTVDSVAGVALWGRPGILVPGAQLTSGQSITSPNGQFHLAMQGDGNLVEYDGTTPAWATGTNSSSSSVAMQGDGNLVVYDSSHNPKWASNTSGNSGAYLVLADNGILTVDSASGVALWGAAGILVPGAQLTTGQSITSPNGQLHLAMQGDGNLVEYDGAAPAYSTRLPSPCMARWSWPLGEVIDWPVVSWAPGTRMPAAPQRATPEAESTVRMPLSARTR